MDVVLGYNCELSRRGIDVSRIIRKPLLFVWQMRLPYFSVIVYEVARY